MNKSFTATIIIFILFSVVMVFIANIQEDIFTAEEENWCGRSLYNPTNATHAGTYSNGKCYYEQFGYYKTNKVCSGGILGIGMSCYESSKSHTKSYREKPICIVLDTGESC